MKIITFLFFFTALYAKSMENPSKSLIINKDIGYKILNELDSNSLSALARTSKKWTSMISIYCQDKVPKSMKTVNCMLKGNPIDQSLELFYDYCQNRRLELHENLDEVPPSVYITTGLPAFNYNYCKKLLIDGFKYCTLHLLELECDQNNSLFFYEEGEKPYFSASCSPMHEANNAKPLDLPLKELIRLSKALFNSTNILLEDTNNFIPAFQLIRLLNLKRISQNILSPEDISFYYYYDHNLFLKKHIALKFEKICILMKDKIKLSPLLEEFIDYTIAQMRMMNRNQLTREDIHVATKSLLKLNNYIFLQNKRDNNFDTIGYCLLYGIPSVQRTKDEILEDFMLLRSFIQHLKNNIGSNYQEIILDYFMSILYGRETPDIPEMSLNKIKSVFFNDKQLELFIEHELFHHIRK